MPDCATLMYCGSVSNLLLRHQMNCKVSTISHHLLHTCLNFMSKQLTELKTRLMLCYLQFCWTHTCKLSHLELLSLLKIPRVDLPVRSTHKQTFDPENPTELSPPNQTAHQRSLQQTRALPCPEIWNSLRRVEFQELWAVDQSHWRLASARQTSELASNWAGNGFRKAPSVSAKPFSTWRWSSITGGLRWLQTINISNIYCPLLGILDFHVTFYTHEVPSIHNVEVMRRYWSREWG